MTFSPYDAQLVPKCIPEEWEYCTECGCSEEDDYLEEWDEGGATLCRKCMARMTAICARCGERSWTDYIDEDGVCNICRHREKMAQDVEDRLTDEAMGR
ncbi:MAG TPA: hypothetical protein PLL10_00080 [Elusimicrobiales bacterium]|nr:hypothetical protein [Elusimicrobiales bacterium]